MPDPKPQSPIPTSLRRVFWGWDRPVLDCAVEELTRDWAGGMLDLSHHAVIVPTENAGRKLREALAIHAAKREAAVLAPLILTPDAVLEWAPPGSLQAATTADSLLAWLEILQSVDLADVPNVFPKEPGARDFTWALQTATTFRRLQHTIGEGGWSINQATKRFGPQFTEAARWKELSGLENLYEKSLARRGLTDRNRVRAQAVAKVKAPESIRKISLFAVSLPTPLARAALEVLANAGLSVDVCIHAPQSLQDTFSPWGEPLVESWRRAVIPLERATEQIRLLSRPKNQAEEITTLCAAAEDPIQQYAVGLIDPEITPHVMVRLKELQIPAFNPEGIPFSNHALHWVLTLWQDLLGNGSWESFASLIQVPEVLSAILESLPEGLSKSASNLLSQADKLQQTHLPMRVDSALQALKRNDGLEKEIGHALNLVSRWIAKFQNSPFDESLCAFLEQIYGRYDLPFGDPAAVAFRQASDHLLRHLNDVTLAAATFPRRLEPAQQLHLLLRLMKEITLFPEHSQDAVELSGWLELPWAKAPGLIIAGMNEGSIPATITSDPWVPHSLRALLGLPTNEIRFARDAYLLTSLLTCRAGNAGQIHLLVGRESGKGDPIKPSRLLMLCTREELAERVQYLFEDASAEESLGTAPWQRAWQLKPSIPTGWKFTKISATSFSKYLQCPFRFFLQQVLKMQDYDPGKQEMDYFDFGNICHTAFQAYGLDESIRQSVDADEIAAFLIGAAAAEVEKRFGRQLTVPLIIQQNSIQQRLTKAAPLLAQNRLDGWQVRYVETTLNTILDKPWEINGVEIRGQIDMVEYHPTDKRWRIIDYKTSARPAKPQEAHLTAAKKETPAHLAHIVEACTVSVDGKDHLWTNLQLPLYAAALEEHFKEPVDAAYFNLPPTMSQVGLVPWPELSASNLTESAMRCARSIIDAISNDHFWPPNTSVKYDDMKDLFIREIEDSVDPSQLLVDAAQRREAKQISSL